MARIALVNIGMHGHVNPTLGFIKELTRRGHEVYFFCTDEFGPMIARTGAKFISYPSLLGQSLARSAQLQAEATAEGKAPPGSTMAVFLEEFGSTFPKLYEHLLAMKPDFIIYDFISLATRIIAQHLDIQTIQFFTTYASNEHYNLVKETFAKHDFPMEEQIQAAQNFIDGVSAKFGCQSTSIRTAFEYTNHDNLVFMPRDFQPSGQTFDERFNFVGPCVRAAHSEEAMSLIPDGDGPIMIISLGSLFHEWPEFYSSCIEAFGHTPWRIVMGIGTKLKPETLGPIPANFRVLAHIPQIELLQYADLFISHGGMNSTMEALSLGVPLVVIPQMEEQELTAQQVDALGLGRFLPRAEVNVDSLAAAISYAVTPAVRANLDTMQEALRVAGGIDRAVAVIEAAPRPSVTPGNFVNLTRTPAPR